MIFVQWQLHKGRSQLQVGGREGGEEVEEEVDEDGYQEGGGGV